MTKLIQKETKDIYNTNEDIKSRYINETQSQQNHL